MERLLPFTVALLAACATSSPTGTETGNPADTSDTADTADTGSWNPTGNLCVTVSRPGEAPLGGTAYVATIAADQAACVNVDTGSTWYGETVTSGDVVDDHFDATVEPGSYGVEVVAGGGWSGCAAVDITGTDVCATEALVELGYEAQVDKPNVYLYPTRPMNVRVSVPARRLTETDPLYPADGWRVRAFPDGRLATPQGARDYLFYELRWPVERFQTEVGWCVRGDLAQASIEDAMAGLGFFPSEIEDFSDAWDPSFPAAEWMTVYPQVEFSSLVIEPVPEHLLRAWFYVTDGCAAVPEPQLQPVDRAGWNAAEWGVSFASPLVRDEVIVEGWR